MTASAPAFEIVTDPVPLEWWDDGSIRVGGTRVRLDTIVTAHNLGHSPEYIATNHGQLPLAVIHATLAYYLAHRELVDEYMRVRAEQAEKFFEEMERKHPTAEMREKLKQRWAEMHPRDPR